MTVTGIRPDIAEEFGLPEKNGVLVIEVEDDSPSAESGLMSGDIIIEVDQARVKDLYAFSKRLTEYKKGETILFLVNRGGITIYLTLKVMTADR
jgi:serine protease Do